MRSAQDLINQKVAKNARNNQSVRKSREKKKKMIEESIKQLDSEKRTNDTLKSRLKSMEKELGSLKNDLARILALYPVEQRLSKIKSIQDRLMMMPRTSRNGNTENIDNVIALIAEYLANNSPTNLPTTPVIVVDQPREPETAFEHVIGETNVNEERKQCEEEIKFNLPTFLFEPNTNNTQTVKSEKKSIQSKPAVESIQSEPVHTIDESFQNDFIELLSKDEELKKIFEKIELDKTYDEFEKQKEVEEIEKIASNLKICANEAKFGPIPDNSFPSQPSDSRVNTFSTTDTSNFSQTQTQIFNITSAAQCNYQQYYDPTPNISEKYTVQPSDLRVNTFSTTETSNFVQTQAQIFNITSAAQGHNNNYQQYYDSTPNIIEMHTSAQEIVLPIEVYSIPFEVFFLNDYQ